MGCDSSSLPAEGSNNPNNPSNGLNVAEKFVQACILLSAHVLRKQDNKHTLKLLLLGDSAVGKSSLMFRFVEGKSPDNMMATVGIDFKWTNVTVGGTSYRVQIWDTAGQEKFRTIARSYYRNVKGYILVYDVTDRFTFEHIEYWLEELTNQGTPGTYKVVVGNKADRVADKKVSTKEGKSFAKQHGAAFIETSALAGTNVSELFNQIVAEYARTLDK